MLALLPAQALAEEISAEADQWGAPLGATVDDEVPEGLGHEDTFIQSVTMDDSCGSGGYKDWKAEGVAWYAPTGSSKPVYRLYNTKSGDHHYTTSAVEKAKLLESGQWRDEGVAFYSATNKDTNTIKIYRVYNGRLKRSQHYYTKNAVERDSLVENSGWRDEGIGFYGYSSANPTAAQPLNVG